MATRSTQTHAQAQAQFLPTRGAVARGLLTAPNVTTARWTMAALGVAALLALAALLIWPAARVLGNAALVACALLALASALGWSARASNTGVAATAVLLIAMGTLTVVVAQSEGGAGHVALGLLPLLVMLTCLSAGFRAAAINASFAAACLLVLHLMSDPGSSAASTHNIGALALQLLLLAVSLAAGRAFARLETRHREAADERERRFSGLLIIAVDAYWELDEQLRLVAFEDSRNTDPTRALAVKNLLGEVPWEQKQFRCDPEVFDRLLADTESRAAFRDVRVQWLSRNGALRHFSIGGEPRFDARGRFRGYWGVVRDTTRGDQAKAALHATEARYQELFSRIPTPLVLHRGGLVVDANPAALQLFGFADLAAIVGFNLLDAYDGSDSRERAQRRLEEIEALPMGEALPVVDFRMRSRTGRAIASRATGVRVHAQGGAATLSIYLDDTEKRRAEVAVRRSEAMLSHLVATSPDVITLTDLNSGRYAMVNNTFERFTGYTSAEVVGKTSAELGIWHDATQRERFVAAVGQYGTASDMSCDFVAKDGRVVTLLVSGAVFVMDKSNFLVINGRDVSEQERVRLERAAVFENASIGIAVTRDQRFLHCNPRFTHMFGWEEGTLAGQPASVIWRSVEIYAEHVQELMARLKYGELVEFERHAKARDGREFYIRVIGKAIDPTRPEASGTLWIAEDVTERHQAADALALARDQAEAANRAKSAFLANTSHELRTPLNGMLGLAQLASSPQLEPGQRQRYLDQIVENAHALAAIVTDVLDLSKIEAGKLSLEQMPFDLSALLDNLRTAYSAMCVGRDLSLAVELDPSAQGHVLGDALRVRQVLSNYLSNALKFTEKGSVTLFAQRAANGHLRFEVRDTGPGLDTATQARIFRPFTQGDESTTRRYGGTGLGLSICRELAQLMDGDVGVQSELGAGATFWVELDLPSTSAPQPVAPVTATRDLTGTRVLMVEDNAVNMIIGVSILERWGVEVEQAVNGALAVAAVARAHEEARPFNAVLMDVQMPVMSGYEATRELRRQAFGQGLPIIALTAAALVSERDEALSAGMDDFLTKPIDAEKLKATLAHWIGSVATN